MCCNNFCTGMVVGIAAAAVMALLSGQPVVTAVTDT